jgi:hypothetical protein
LTVEKQRLQSLGIMTAHSDGVTPSLWKRSEGLPTRVERGRPEQREGLPLRVERGLVRRRVQRTATIIQEGVPFWLGGVRRLDWGLLRMSAWTPRHQWDHPEIAGAMVKLNDIIENIATAEELMKTANETDVVLVSGTLGFLVQLLPRLQLLHTPILMFVEKLARRVTLPSGNGIEWRRISHKEVGGVTSLVVLFGFIHLKNWELKRRVERTLGHIVNFGTRPRMAIDGNPIFKHYKVGDRLQTKALDVPVVFSTHWYSSGFGYRTLSAHELSSAFDLPLWLHPSGEEACNAWLTSDAFSKMYPLSLFNIVIDTVLDTLGAADLKDAPSNALVSHLPLTLGDDSGVTLPLIGRFLPHSWVDVSLITEKAGKADDAGVPIHLWDQRISLVLEVPLSVIATMRKWLFKRYCRGLMRSLALFLSRCHGSDWAQQLTVLRKEHSRQQSVDIPPLKRLRGGESFFDLIRNADAAELM